MGVGENENGRGSGMENEGGGGWAVESGIDGEANGIDAVEVSGNLVRRRKGKDVLGAVSVMIDDMIALKPHNQMIEF